MAECIYFGSCGGCTIQNIPYEVQLEKKKAELQTLLRVDDVKVVSDAPFKYRNRMDFVFHGKGLGLRKRGSFKEIIDIERCPISEDRINELLTEVRAYFRDADAFNPAKRMGTFRYAVLRTTGSGASVSFMLNEDSLKLKEAIEKIKEYAQVSSAEHVAIAVLPHNSDDSTSLEYFMVKGDDFLEEELMGRSFKFNIQGFFQNNTKMAQKLQEYVHSVLKEHDTKEAHLLDLYGGVGTFGIVNADLFKSVDVVEEFAPAIEIAEENIKVNDAQNVNAHVLDAKNIKRMEFPKPLYIITDPPRSGMHPETVRALNQSQAELIVYISCNPKQLAKDIPKFTNYALESAALFDLFPQTNHMEAVVVLRKC